MIIVKENNILKSAYSVKELINSKKIVYFKDIMANKEHVLELMGGSGLISHLK